MNSAQYHDAPSQGSGRGRLILALFGLTVGLVLILSLVPLVIIFQARTATTRQYEGLKDNVSQKILVVNKVILAANRIIAYDPRFSDWKQSRVSRDRLLPPKMASLVLKGRISEETLDMILKHDPLHIKMRITETLARYEEALSGLERLPRRTDRPVRPEKREEEKAVYLDLMRLLLQAANSHSDELIQVQEAYFAFLEAGALKSMIWLRRLLVALLAFILLTGGLAVVFLRDRKRLTQALFEDIAERKKTKVANEKLIQELKEALEEVDTLRGFLPICTQCKKIRDDSGYWQQIDIYIKDRSKVEFSHSICPDCAAELYPDIKLEWE